MASGATMPTEKKPNTKKRKKKKKTLSYTKVDSILKNRHERESGQELMKDLISRRIIPIIGPKAVQGAKCKDARLLQFRCLVMGAVLQHLQNNPGACTGLRSTNDTTRVAAIISNKKFHTQPPPDAGLTWLDRGVPAALNTKHRYDQE